MKKRIRVISIIAVIFLLLLLIVGIVFTRFMRTDYPDAVTEVDGVYMEWVDEPSRRNLTFRICNDLDDAVYGGSQYVVEYCFLGGWYNLIDWDWTATYDLDLWIVEGHTDHTVMHENPSSIYNFLPSGKYRIIKRFYTVQDFVLYENRDKYIDLYLEFELD